MVRRKKIRITGIAILGLLSVTFLSMSYSLRKPIRDGSLPQGQKRFQNVENQRMVDSAIRLLRTGDLVLRTGADVTSYIFTQFNQTDKTYSHCGLVVVEDGYPFVYHSIGGEDNPNEKLRRDSASFWFSPANNLGFGIARFSFDSSQTAALQGIVYQYFREQRRFDMDFDLSTDDRLYCAEFVYKALNQAVKDSSFIRPVSRLGKTFVAVDNLFLNSHAKLVCQVRYK
jgi:hypothetical protein